MNNDSNTLEEYRIQVEHQIDDIQENRRHASLFLRILIASAGIIAAIVTSTDVTSIFLSLIGDVDPKAVFQATSGETNGSQYIADVLVLSIIVSAIVLTVLSIAQFFFLIPKRAYEAAKPKEMKFSGAMHNCGFLSEEETTHGFHLVSKYEKIIEHNAGIIDKTRDHLDNCYRSAKVGIMSGASGMLLWLSLAREDPLLIFGLAFVGLAVFYRLLEREYDVSDYVSDFQFLKVTDGGALAIMGLTILLFEGGMRYPSGITMFLIFMYQGIAGLVSEESDHRAGIHLMAWIIVPIALELYVGMTRESAMSHDFRSMLIFSAFMIGFFGLWGRITGEVAKNTAKRIMDSIAELKSHLNARRRAP